MREGNLPVRFPIGGSTRERTNVRVTIAPTSGRRFYMGEHVKYREVVDTILTITGSKKTFKFYNKLESANGTPFLIVGDEVEIWREGALWLCTEIPRGFL